MNTSLHLEWLHEGQWHRVGWIASTEQSKAHLREHGRLLASFGGEYRLVIPDYPGCGNCAPRVVHVYSRSA